MTTPRRLVAAGLLALTALVSPALVATAPAVLAATPLALAPAPAATLAVAPASQLVPVPLDPDSDGPTAQDDGTATFGVQPAGPTEPDSRTSYD